MLPEVAEAVAKEIFSRVKDSGERSRVLVDREKSHGEEAYLCLKSEADQLLGLSEMPEPDIVPYGFGDAAKTRKILKKWLAGGLAGLFDVFDSCLMSMGRPQVEVNMPFSRELAEELETEMPANVSRSHIARFKMFLVVSLGANYITETDDFVALGDVLDAGAINEILTMTKELEDKHRKPAPTWRDRPSML